MAASTVRSVTPLAGVLALLAALAWPSDWAAAQDLPMTATLSINAGVQSHRLDGAGTNPFFALRADYVVSDLSVAEFAVGYGHPEQDFGRSHFMVAEGQYQIRYPFERLAPYAGMGAGVAVDAPLAAGIDPRVWPTFAVGAGVRAWLDDRTRVRTDVRWRGIGADFGRSSFEWTFGLGWRW